MIKVEIKCDACEADLTDAGATPKYRLHLSSESIPNSGTSLFAIAVYPEVKGAMHFCGLKCLDLWRGRERLRSHLWAQWWEKRKTKTGLVTASEEESIAQELEINEIVSTSYPTEKK